MMPYFLIQLGIFAELLVESNRNIQSLLETTPFVPCFVLIRTKGQHRPCAVRVLGWWPSVGCFRMGYVGGGGTGADLFELRRMNE